MTSKGQATIPNQMRDKFGIKPGDRVIFEDINGQLVIKTHAQQVEELAGSLKPKVKVKYTDKMADKAIGRMFAEEYRKKYGQTG